MDTHVRQAIETIRRSGHDIMRDWAVLLAFRYLHARTPAKSSARAAVERVEKQYLAHHGPLAAPERVPWSTVKGSIAQLAEIVEELPPVQTLTAPAHLRELTNDVLGAVPGWSHTDPARATAVVTGNHLCEECGPVVGQTVVLARDGVPVAQVSLGALLAWACDGALSQLPERARAS